MRRLDAIRTRLGLLIGCRAAESRMDEEFRFHLDMETERLVREEGLDPSEARRRALIAFGGVERHKEALRDGRGLAWLGGLSLDFKLGFRMLVKYPGLTIVGGLAMAFAIWAGVVTFVRAPRLRDPPGSRGAHRRPSRIRDSDDLPGDPTAEGRWADPRGGAVRSRFGRTARVLGGDRSGAKTPGGGAGPPRGRADRGSGASGRGHRRRATWAPPGGIGDATGGGVAI